MTDTRCAICFGLWSPFPCPYDKAQPHPIDDPNQTITTTSEETTA